MANNNNTIRCNVIFFLFLFPRHEVKIFSICADQKGRKKIVKNKLKVSTQKIEKKVKRRSKFKLVESCKGRKHNQKKNKK